MIIDGLIVHVTTIGWIQFHHYDILSAAAAAAGIVTLNIPIIVNGNLLVEIQIVWFPTGQG